MSGSGGAQDHPKGTTVLVLGIVGLACCGLLAPVAWIMGTNVVREIDAAPGVYRNRTTANAGRICGIVGTVFLILGILYTVTVGAWSFNVNF